MNKIDDKIYLTDIMSDYEVPKFFKRATGRKRCIIDIYGPKIWDTNPWVWVYEFEGSEE